MKVLVVDDSVVFRTAIKSSLASNPQIREVKVAGNGKIAIDMLKQEDFDAMTLDLEMPVMDGVDTINAVREFNKTIPIIIFSAQNINAANKTLKALEMGASDFVQKIEGSGDLNENLRMIERELVPKFKAFLDKLQNIDKPVQKIESTKKLNISEKVNMICIGSSTGGPDTLKNIFKHFKENINIPILVVQHMPPVFTAQLAKALDQITPMNVVEAQDGDLIKAGTCYIAPGDFHMVMEVENGQNIIRLKQTEKVCYVRPAVDVMLDSVAKNFQGKVATFILTGMGNDGANGCKNMKMMRKGPVIIQDEKSCVVFGMPKAVYELGIYDEILSMDEIPNLINQLC